VSQVFDPDSDAPELTEGVPARLRVEDTPAAAGARADAALTELDFGRRVTDERILVCEGPCNPDIYDYDTLVIQMQAGNQFLVGDVAFRARRLHHTRHVRSRSEHWDIMRGWIRSFRCEICGHVRKF